MSTDPVPSKAVGRVGLVAQVRGGPPALEGRLVVVREPAGRLCAVLGLRRPTFCWTVRLMGAPVTLEGREVRDVYLPDRCLVPLSDLSEAGLGALLQDQFQADREALLGRLRRRLGAEGQTLDAVERIAIQLKARLDIDRALERMAVPQALAQIGFRPQGEGSEVLVRTLAWKGFELTLSAGRHWRLGWTVVGHGRRTGEGTWIERDLPEEAALGDVAEAVLAVWWQAGGFPQGSPVPEGLELGLTARRHRQWLQRACGGMPALQVDRTVFRAVCKWLRDAGSQDLLDDGHPRIRLSQEGALLRLEVHGTAYGCPAQGLWVEPCELRLRDLVAIPETALRGRRLVLVQAVDAVWLAGVRLARLS